MELAHQSNCDAIAFINFVLFQFKVIFVQFPLKFYRINFNQKWLNINFHNATGSNIVWILLIGDVTPAPD